jgi:hypothetical protein
MYMYIMSSRNVIAVNAVVVVCTSNALYVATVHFHVYLDSSLVDSSSLNNTLNRGKELYLKIYIELRRTEKYIESS